MSTTWSRKCASGSGRSAGATKIPGCVRRTTTRSSVARSSTACARRGTLSHATPAAEADAEGVVKRLGAPDGSPDAAFAEAERAERLQAAIQRLPESRRQAVRLFLQRFAVDEIAELLGCDRNRAHNLTYRGTRQLKQDLSGGVMSERFENLARPHRRSASGGDCPSGAAMSALAAGRAWPWQDRKSVV